MSVSISLTHNLFEVALQLRTTGSLQPAKQCGTFSAKVCLLTSHKHSGLLAHMPCDGEERNTRCSSRSLITQEEAHKAQNAHVLTAQELLLRPCGVYCMPPQSPPPRTTVLCASRCACQRCCMLLVVSRHSHFVACNSVARSEASP